ncbi:MAG TPA: hypothetical protein VFK94_06385 [Patescibacteria group bacterium]|nr:hypothetical protein [Patescibacteria group bacterium]
MATRTTRMAFRHAPRRRGAASINLGADFGQGIDTLTEQVRYLQDQEALENLPTDPRGFIEYAKKRTQELGSDPDAAIWNELVKRAEFKIEEMDWQQGVREGTKTLEGFRDFLVQRFQSAKPGSIEAQQALSDLDSVKRAIGAKSENSADQGALFAYMQSGDYETYMRYLQSKLSRAQGRPQVQATLLKQIAELRTRAERAKQTERTTQRSQVVNDYLLGKISSSQAIAKLQTLQTAPGITPAEVNAITTDIGQILNREKSGSSSAAATGTTDRLRSVEKDYTEAVKVIREKMGTGAVTQEDWARLNIASENLMAVYGEVADMYAAKGNADSVRTWTDRQNAVPQWNRDLAYSVDKATIGDAVVSSQAFLQGIAHLDPQVKIKKIAERVAHLNDQATSLRSDKGRDDLKSAIAELQGQADSIINSTSTRDISVTEKQKDQLNHEYSKYVQRWKTEDSTTDKMLNESDFPREIRYSNSAADFSAVAGVQYDDQQFSQLRELVVPKDTRAQEAEGLQDIYNFWSNQGEKSLDLAKKLGLSWMTEGAQSPDAADRNELYGPVPEDRVAPRGRSGGLRTAEGVQEDTPVAQEARTLDTPQEQPAPAIPEDVIKSDTGEDSRTINDYLDEAMSFLDEPTPIDIPEFQIPELPEDTPFDISSSISTEEGGETRFDSSRIF